MSDVFLLVHDDRSYDMGDMEIRGAYATREAAEKAIVTRTASGARSRAWAAHNESCCGVRAFDIEAAPVIDIREDDPPLTGPGIVPDAMIEEIAKATTAVSIYERLARR